MELNKTQKATLYMRKWRRKNADRINTKARERYKNDPLYHFSICESIRKSRIKNYEKILEEKKRYRAKPETIEYMKKYRHAYYIKYKEKIDKENKLYRQENPEKVKLMHQKHYQNNREKYLIQSKENKEKNPEKWKAYYRKYAQQHKEETKKRFLRWYKEYSKTELYKRSCRVNSMNRKIRFKNITPLTKQIVQLVYEDNIKRFGTLTCYLCLKPIEFGNDHLEHKIPICRNGTNEYNNLGVSCKYCNISKNRKTEEEFQKYKLEVEGIR